jgi:hypothetical protein
MLPGNYDWTIYQGDQFIFTFTLQTWTNYPTKPEVLAAENLTGKTVRFQVRKSATSATILASGSTATGEVVVATPANGTIVITISGLVTKLFDFSCGHYDIETYTDINNPETVLEGKVTLTKQVTR